MLNANFWQDKANSNKVIKEKKFYEELTNSFENSIKSLGDLDDLFKQLNNSDIKEYIKNNINNSLCITPNDLKMIPIYLK